MLKRAISWPRAFGFRITKPAGKMIADVLWGKEGSEDQSIRQFNRIVDLITESKNYEGLSAAGDALEYHITKFRDAELYNYGQSLIGIRFYQIEAEYRDEYPIEGIDYASDIINQEHPFLTQYR